MLVIQGKEDLPNHPETEEEVSKKGGFESPNAHSEVMKIINAYR